MTQGEYYAQKGCYKERHIHRLRDDFWKLKIYLAKEINFIEETNTRVDMTE